MVWPDGQEQYKWGAYMNDYPAWAAENSEFNEEIVDTKVYLRGVRARGIKYLKKKEIDLNLLILPDVVSRLREILINYWI